MVAAAEGVLTLGNAAFSTSKYCGANVFSCLTALMRLSICFRDLGAGEERLARREASLHF